MSYKEYQPLRVCGDWAFEWNCFFEVDPSPENMSYFAENLLLLSSKKRKRSIELQWQPENDPKGEYILKVINLQETYDTHLKRVFLTGDWGNPYFIFRAKNRVTIVDKLEELFFTLDEYKDSRIFKSPGIVDTDLEALRNALEKEGYSYDLAQKINNSNNAVLQSLLIDQKRVGKEVLLFLKEFGAKKSIKNKALQKLNSKHYRNII